MSSFSFVSNGVLRANLDRAFDHIVDLLALSESESYKNKSVLIGSLRKTIVIHTASIIEALLLWMLKRKLKSGDVELSDEMKYFDIKILYLVQKTGLEIIAGRRKKVKKKVDRLDFIRIIDLTSKYRIITKNFSKELHKVRKLRNRLHIGGLKQIEKEFTRENLEFTFFVAKKTKKIAAKSGSQNT